MQSVSPLKGKSNEDRYEESTALFVVLQIVLWVYIAGSIAYLVLIMNVTIRHTYLTPATMPGTLVSDRYDTFLWIFLFLSVVANIGMPFILTQLILWRKSGGCTIFWIIFLFLFVMINAITVAVLGVYLGNCNGQNQNGNICNDLEWCCAPEIYGNPGNLCPNTGMCTPPKSLSELSSNVDFRWLFAVSVVFLIFGFGMLIAAIVLGIGSALKMEYDIMEEEGEEGEEAQSQEETRVNIPTVSTSSAIRRRTNQTTVKKELISHRPKQKTTKGHTQPGIVPSFKALKNQ